MVVVVTEVSVTDVPVVVVVVAVTLVAVAEVDVCVVVVAVDVVVMQELQSSGHSFRIASLVCRSFALHRRKSTSSHATGSAMPLQVGGGVVVVSVSDVCVAVVVVVDVSVAVVVVVFEVLVFVVRVVDVAVAVVAVTVVDVVVVRVTVVSVAVVNVDVVSLHELHSTGQLFFNSEPNSHSATGSPLQLPSSGLPLQTPVVVVAVTEVAVSVVVEEVADVVVDVVVVAVRVNVVVVVDVDVVGTHAPQNSGHITATSKPNCPGSSQADAFSASQPGASGKPLHTGVVVVVDTLVVVVDTVVDVFVRVDVVSVAVVTVLVVMVTEVAVVDVPVVEFVRVVTVVVVELADVVVVVVAVDVESTQVPHSTLHDDRASSRRSPAVALQNSTMLEHPTASCLPLHAAVVVVLDVAVADVAVVVVTVVSVAVVLVVVVVVAVVVEKLVEVAVVTVTVEDVVVVLVAAAVVVGTAAVVGSHALHKIGHVARTLSRRGMLSSALQKAIVPSSAHAGRSGMLSHTGVVVVADVVVVDVAVCVADVVVAVVVVAVSVVVVVDVVGTHALHLTGHVDFIDSEAQRSSLSKSHETLSGTLLQVPGHVPHKTGQLRRNPATTGSFGVFRSTMQNASDPAQSVSSPAPLQVAVVVVVAVLDLVVVVVVSVTEVSVAVVVVAVLVVVVVVSTQVLHVTGQVSRTNCNPVVHFDANPTHLSGSTFPLHTPVVVVVEALVVVAVAVVVDPSEDVQVDPSASAALTAEQISAAPSS